MRAAEILGGTEELRRALHVPPRALAEWLAGVKEPPMDVFLQAVDIISKPARMPSPPSVAAKRAAVLERQSRELMDHASRTVAQARRTIAEGRNVPPGPRVAQFFAASFHGENSQAMLRQALAAGMDAAHARMGNVQLKESAGLRIVAQDGFGEPFLSFFALVDDADSACGAAAGTRQRVVVRDVATDPIFVGKPSAAVMQAAGARACQSTPLVGTQGEVLGMLSTHYGEPYAPSPAECRLLDAVARRAAYWLERATA